MKRKSGICLMIILLMIMSTFSVTSSVANNDDHPGIVYFDKTVKESESGEWLNNLHDVVIGDTVSFKLTITYVEAGYYDEVQLSLKKINIFDVLPYGLEYIDGSSTVDGTPMAPEISEGILHWNLTGYDLDENENHSIIFNALVVFSENVEYIQPETEIENFAYVTAWECGHIYYHGADELHDYADVYVKNKIEVTKELLNWKWMEEIIENGDGVILGQTLTFKITITYYGPYILDSLEVTDHLPDCIEYADNVVIIGAENVIPSVGEGEIIIWFWEKDVNLGNGETVTITFDTTVIEYCEETQHNSVSVLAESFCHETYLGYAEIPVNCAPHEPIFEKTVWNGEQWVEIANVFVNDTVRFRIKLTYYGISNLTDIKIIDELPCDLRYAGNEKIQIVHSAEYGIENLDIDSNVSEDKKTVWWNLTKELSDRDTLKIEFDALVTGCGECGINTATYSGYSNGYDYSGSDTAQISSKHKPPVPPTEISITLKGINLGRIRGTIFNLGDGDLSNVKCIISVRGGILKRAKLDKTFTFEEIKAGGSAPISTARRDIKRAFGRITVKITVFIGDKKFNEYNFKGFIFGRLIRLKPA